MGLPDKTPDTAVISPKIENTMVLLRGNAMDAELPGLDRSNVWGIQARSTEPRRKVKRF